jgi:hypothetical protein
MLELDNYFKKWSILINMHLGLDIIDGTYIVFYIVRGQCSKRSIYLLEVDICVKATRV